MNKSKIIQLCPSQSGWRLVQVTDGDVFELPIACWALHADGSVRAMVDYCDEGELSCAEDGTTLLAPGVEIGDVWDRSMLEWHKKWSRFEMRARMLEHEFDLPPNTLLDFAPEGTDDEMEAWALELLRRARSPMWAVRALRRELAFKCWQLYHRLRRWYLGWIRC